jgi:hypothetical protein
MISIPIINSAIPKKIDTNTTPAYGDAITKKDIAMAKAPAPMLNPLAQPGLSLLPRGSFAFAILFLRLYS